MIRQPTKNEFCVIGAWILTGLSAAFMGISSKGWISLLWSIYGNKDWPATTDLYLSSAYWFSIVPFVTGIVIWVIWSRRQLDRFAAFIQLGLHSLSVGILFFTFIAAIWPLMSTTFRMSR